MKFSTRIRTFDINLTLTNFDAHVQLPEIIRQECLEPFHMSCFDRIETSNLADYTTVPQILNDWGPMLSRRNRHATLLMYVMNWEIREPHHGYGLDKLNKAAMSKYSSIITVSCQYSWKQLMV
jgi:hypothetical protein